MGFLRVCLAVRPSFWRSRRSADHRAGAEEAPIEVDAAVVLAAGVSRSIDDGEFVLERLGYAEAIQSQKLLDAISTAAALGAAGGYRTQFAAARQRNMRFSNATSR
jgi:Protein of unknown function (DUF1194)